MRYAIYPVYDATLYEKYPKRNTGIDQIIELDKTLPDVPDIDGFYWDGVYNSRIVMKFDINYLTSLINQGRVSSKSQYYLSLKATQAQELPLEYTVHVHPLAKSWVNGQGHLYDNPELDTGVSWKYRNGYFFDQGQRWYSGSLQSGTTGSYSTVQGGGIWYTSSLCTYTLNYVSVPDVRINVTPIVKQWLSGSIPNHGFIIKHTPELENDLTFAGSLKFFGRDSHTVFLPKLEIAWDDSTHTGTSSLSEVGDNFVVHISNIKKQYRSESKEVFRVSAREAQPPLTFATSSRYLQVKRLPTSSYYAIQDYSTTEYIIPFDTGSTKLSVDSKGNFFRMDMNVLLPDRYYKIMIKCIQDGGNIEQIFDDGYYFKVVR